MATNLQKMK